MDNMTHNTTLDAWHNATNASCEADYYGSAFRTFKVAVDVYVVGALVVLGVAGNTLSGCVLRAMKAPPLLLLLCAADSAFLLTCLVFQTGRAVFFYFPVGWWWFPWVEVWVWPLAAVAQTSAVYVVVLVTVDRWRAVCFPLRPRPTPRTVLLATGAVLAWALLFNAPTWLDMEVRYINTTCRYEARASALFTHAHYQLIYKTLLCLVFRAALPLLLLIVLNVRLIRSLTRQPHLRTTATGHRGEHDEHRLTALVIALISAFLLCALPDVVMRVLTALELYAPHLLPVQMIHLAYLGTVSNLFLTINSAANFLIYCASGSRFRLHLRLLLLPGGKKYKHVTSSEDHRTHHSLTHLSLTPPSEAQHRKLHPLVPGAPDTSPRPKSPRSKSPRSQSPRSQSPRSQSPRSKSPTPQSP